MKRLLGAVKRKAVHYRQEVRLRQMTPPSWILVVYAIVTGVCIEVGASITLALVTGLSPPSCFHLEPETNIYTQYVTLTLRKSVFCLIYPLTGWIADTILGRGRSITWGLWSCWVGSLLQGASYCIQFYTCGLPVNLAKYGVSGIAFVLLTFGTSGLITNLPAFGLDQLYDRSNTHARAFVHWFVWGLFVGYPIQYIVYNQTSLHMAEVVQITGLYAFIVTSAALCIHGFFKDTFIDPGVLKRNPYKLVLNVLRYAMKHKTPEKRSAMTYWEDAIPSRIDLGKSKYGGPFKEEDVEDVKTFWRITLMIFSTCGLYIPYYYSVIGILGYGSHYQNALVDLNGFGMFALWQSLESTIIILVPLFELVMIPCLPKLEYFVINPLKALGVAYILVAVCTILMMVIEVVGETVTLGYPTDCDESFRQISLSYFYFAIPLVLTGLVEVLSFIYGIEFICSQGPANMKGMLIGIFWLVRIAFVNIGSLFSLWTPTGPAPLPCSFWILTIQLVICITGLVVFVVASKRYKRRSLEQTYNLHYTVANTYGRVLDSARNINESVEESELYVVVSEEVD